MSRRIRRPVDQDAFDRAFLRLQQRHGDWLADVRSQTPGTRQHRRLREKWLDYYVAEGGQVVTGTLFQAPLPGGAVEPCPIKNRIAQVDFLHGDANTFVAGNALQHVNLPRLDEFVGGGIPNRDRLGRTIRVRVAFQRPKREHFKVALLSHNANATYTAEERGRKASFDFDRQAAEHPQGAFDRHHGAVYTGRTNAQGIAVLEAELEVSPAGGDQYRLVAWDEEGNVVVSAGTIETTRTIYYATFLADDPNGVRIDQAWFRAQLEQEYALHHVRLVYLGSVNLPGFIYHDTVMSDDTGQRVEQATAANNGALGRPYADYKPFLLRFVFVDHSAQARKRAIEPFEQDAVHPHDVLSVPIFMANAHQRAADPLFDWRKPVWRGLGEVKYEGDRIPGGHPWFQSARMTVIYGGGQPDEHHDLDVGALTLVPRGVGAPDAMVELQVDVGDRIVGQARVRIEATLMYMYQSVLGQTLTNQFAGITVQPARSYFAPIPTNSQLASALHEAGHALGMCPSAVSQGLQHARFYDYNGQHCWESIAGPAAQVADYHAPPLKDTGTCVMYGLIPDGAPNLHFCNRCAPLLRKLDLSDGLAT